MKFQFVGITKMIEQQASNLYFTRNFMFAYYKPIIKREVALSHADPRDKILCIGGGYMPCSAILFQQLTGAHITIIDNDKHTISYAQKIVDKLGLTDKITIRYQDGKDMLISEYDIIHMAMQVSPKTKVFNHVYSDMKTGARFIIRQPKKHLSGGYNAHVCSTRVTSSVVQPNYCNMERSLLYVK